MSFVHGKNAVVLWDQYNLSAFLNSYEPKASADLPATTTFGASGVRRQVVGLKDGAMSFGGYHDVVAGGSHPVFTAALGAAAAAVVTVGKEGTAIGKPMDMMSARSSTYGSGSPVDGVVPCTVEAMGDGQIDFGVSLKALAATTATGDSASVDNGAATANGGVGHIHATASSGTPTLDSKIQHSVDNSVWVDLGITFTQLTAPGKQRVELAAGTTVNRYTRETHTVGGTTPSVTYAVAFARR